MKLLLKAVLILVAIFTVTLIAIKTSGVLTVEDVKLYFESLKNQPSYNIGTIVVLILFIDLFIAVPTMTTILLSGYFLGFQSAVVYVFLGLLFASLTGYYLSKKYGDYILDKLSSNKEQKDEMIELFNNHAFVVIVLSRAVPMLPEICACLAGTCNMPLRKYLLAWSLGTLPYLAIMVYAGSISNLDNPMPAIYTALGITLLFSLMWYIFVKINKKKKAN